MVDDEYDDWDDPDDDDSDEQFSRIADDPRPKAPTVIAIGAVVAVLIVVGLVGFLVSRAGPSGVPTSQMTPSHGQLKLELPLNVGDLSRNPNAESSSELGEGAERVEARSATYIRDRTDSLYVVIARPIAEPSEMLALLDARAIREVGAGYCGRDSSDLDVCVIVREDIGVLAAGLENQAPEQIISDALMIGDALQRH